MLWSMLLRLMIVLCTGRTEPMVHYVTRVLITGTQKKNLSTLGTVYLLKDTFIYNVLSLLIPAGSHRKIRRPPEHGITVHRGVCFIDQPHTLSFLFFSIVLIFLHLSLFTLLKASEIV